VILSDARIKMALADKLIEIHPDPREVETLWSSTTLDLRLGEELLVWHPPEPSHEEFVVNVDDSFSAARLISERTRSIRISQEGYVLRQGRFILGWTLERVSLPTVSRLAARVEGKSSLARIGMGVHVTAPTIHGGFGFDPGKADGVP
jgi:dCTP deaminase